MRLLASLITRAVLLLCGLPSLLQQALIGSAAAAEAWKQLVRLQGMVGLPDRIDRLGHAGKQLYSVVLGDLWCP